MRFLGLCVCLDSLKIDIYHSSQKSDLLHVNPA